MKILVLVFLGVVTGCSPFAPVEEPPEDAGFPSVDSFDSGAVATSSPDAGGTVSDAGAPDAGLRGGCFDRPVPIGSFPTTGRPHLRIQAVAPFEHGWIVAMSGNAAGSRFLVLDPLGNLVASEEAPHIVDALFVDGSRVIVLASYWASRLDLGPRGIARRYPPVVMLGTQAHDSAIRPEGILASEPITGGARVLTHHFDQAGSRSRLRLSEVTLDDTSASGLRQRTGELAEIPGIDPFYSDRFVLAGEASRGFLWIQHAFRTRLKTVQLGMSGVPAALPVRVLADHPFEAFDLVTFDRQAVLTTHLDGGASMRELPEGTTAPQPTWLSAGRPFGPAPGVHDLGDGRVLLTTPNEVAFFDRASGVEVGPAIPFSRGSGPGGIGPGFREAGTVVIASRPGVAVFVSVEGAGTDELVLRCLAVPPPP